MNQGEQTVREYRNTVLIPKAFARTSSASYTTNLSQHGEVTIGEQEYNVYGNFIPTPIFKTERICIGKLLLKADPGEYVFLWQIRCDDGIFPTETTYGEIKMRVTPYGDLVKRAEEHLGDK